METTQKDAICVGIVGFGNLGRAIRDNLPPDMNLVGIFSRRKVDGCIPLKDIKNHKIDVVFFCGGSDRDAPIIVPKLHRMGFNTVDSYDNHNNITNYKKSIKTKKTTAIIGAGWDPGLFSVMRIYMTAFGLTPNTSYGPGVSMGHTNALKAIPDVTDAQQITYPNKRVCYVITKHKKQVHGAIKTHPYFQDLPTTIKFVKKITPSFHHAGEVATPDNQIKLTVKMQSNPTFTARIMIAYARAIKKLDSGAFTVDEIPPSYLLDYDITYLI